MILFIGKYLLASDYFYRDWQSDTNMPQFEAYDPFIKDEQYLDDLLIARVLIDQDVEYIYDEFMRDYRESEDDDSWEFDTEVEDTAWGSVF